jgi:beta-phosphoglucomutase-like phosphatase (HAD superfamily)
MTLMLTLGFMQFLTQAMRCNLSKDTPYDIQAANACGVEVIALRCGGFDETQLASAIAIYNDPANLLAHFNSSPLGEAA